MFISLAGAAARRRAESVATAATAAAGTAAAGTVAAGTAVPDLDAIGTLSAETEEGKGAWTGAGCEETLEGFFGSDPRDLGSGLDVRETLVFAIGAGAAATSVVILRVIFEKEKRKEKKGGVVLIIKKFYRKRLQY